MAPEGGNGTWMRQKERGLLPDSRNQFVQIIRSGRAFPRLDLHRVIDVIEQTVLQVVDEFALLPLFDLFDDQAQLFFDLIVRAAVHVGDARLQIEHRGYRAQRVLARLLLVVHINFRQIDIVVWAAFNGAAARPRGDDLVHTIRSGFDRNPLQEVHQPARRDGLHHGDRLGDGRKLTRLLFVQRVTDFSFIGHAIRSSSWGKLESVTSHRPALIAGCA